MIADLELLGDTVQMLATEALQQQAANLGLSDSNIGKDDEIRVIQGRYESTVRRLNMLLSHGHRDSYEQGQRDGLRSAEASYMDEIAELKAQIQRMTQQLEDRGVLAWMPAIDGAVVEVE